MVQATLCWLDQPHIRSWGSWVIIGIACLITSIAGALAATKSHELSKQVERAEVYRAILDRVNSAVVVFDSAGTICEWNDSAAQLFGWQASEAVGSDILMLVPATEREQFKTRYTNGIKNKQLLASRHLDCWLLTKNGELLHALMSVRLAARGDAAFGFAMIDRYHANDVIVTSKPPQEAVKAPSLQEFKRSVNQIQEAQNNIKQFSETHN